MCFPNKISWTTQKADLHPGLLWAAIDDLRRESAVSCNTPLTKVQKCAERDCSQSISTAEPSYCGGIHKDLHPHPSFNLSCHLCPRPCHNDGRWLSKSHRRGGGPPTLISGGPVRPVLTVALTGQGFKETKTGGRAVGGVSCQGRKET